MDARRRAQGMDARRRASGGARGRAERGCARTSRKGDARGRAERGMREDEPKGGCEVAGEFASRCAAAAGQGHQRPRRRDGPIPRWTAGGPSSPAPSTRCWQGPKVARGGRSHSMGQRPRTQGPGPQGPGTQRPGTQRPETQRPRTSPALERSASALAQGPRNAAPSSGACPLVVRPRRGCASPLSLSDARTAAPPPAQDG